MCEVVQTIETKNHIAEIIRDDFSYSPREDDCLGTLIALHDSYDISDHSDWTKKQIEVWSNRKDILCLPVYMYEHSQVALSTMPFSCKWDSGQVGIIFVSHKDIIEQYGELNLELATEVLKGEVEEYSQYLNGESFGYIINNDSGDEIDSCWGFIGYDNIQEIVNQELNSLEKE